jgi:hypothetical protein
VREWSGRPATECDRCARCGKEDLNDSSKSSFGFCVVLSGGQSSESTRARVSSARRDART